MKYENGEIKIDAWEMIQYLPKEKLLEFIETFACHDVVIKHVTDQIIEGWTENMNCGSTDYPTKSEPSSALNCARRRIAKESGEIAREEIGALERALKSGEEEMEKLREENWKLRESNQKLSDMLR
jgi:hypothetical protein